MRRLEGAGHQPSPSFGELDHGDLYLEAHRAIIEAKFNEIQSSFVSFYSQQSQFRTKIL